MARTNGATESDGVVAAKYRKLMPEYTKLRYRHKYVLDSRGKYVEHAVNRATREMFRKMSKQREHICGLTRKVSVLTSDLCKSRRCAKRMEDEAARLGTTVNDYEQTLAEIERADWTKAHDLIPEHIQLRVREENEPSEMVSGSMDDVGLELEVDDES